MPSLLDKGEPADKGPAKPFHIYIAESKYKLAVSLSHHREMSDVDRMSLAERIHLC